MKYDKKLILEDGTEYRGYGGGNHKADVMEVVFNTSMTGYQELLSDPSYTGQAVVMAYPLIGNYGLTNEDFESRLTGPAALIVREMEEEPSNFRAVSPLRDYLESAGIPWMAGVDTRRLIRHIRDCGSQKGVITDAEVPVEEGLGWIRESFVPKDVVRRCSCRKRWYSRTSNPRFHVVAIDCGMKQNIVRSLNQYKCNVTVVPYDTDWKEILSLMPDGVLVSNGPGNPEDVPEAVDTLRRLRTHVPIFGICLGHQLMALSGGASTYKLKFGHRGGNHPVKDLQTGRVEITSQNHSYAVDAETLKGTGMEVSHVNLLDGTVEGLICVRDRMLSVQYHPESAPGPRDSMHLFSRFTELMKKE